MTQLRLIGTALALMTALFLAGCAAYDNPEKDMRNCAGAGPGAVCNR
jgi:hypothetical protein